MADDLAPQQRLERVAMLLDMGRLDDAQREALGGVAAVPDSDRLWAALAAVEHRRADFAAAIYAAERALSLNPGNQFALQALGPAYFHSGRRDDARRAMDDLVALAPTWPPALLQRASVYSWTARTEADRAVVRENGSHALALEPHNAEAYGEVAEAHYFIGDTGTAVSLLDDGLRIDPTSESLLLKKVRFGGMAEKDAIATARSILATNPRNVHVLRLLHFATWRRLIRVAAWPSIVGALSAALAYSFFLHGGAQGARVWLAILLVPALIAWLAMFARLAAVGPPERLAAVFRSAPLGLLGFVITVFTNVALTGAILTLFLMPTGDPQALEQVLNSMAAIVIALASGDALMRFAAARQVERTGLFDESPEGRVSASYALRGQFDGTFGRLGTAVIVLFALVAAAWMPGAPAMTAIAAALVATVLAKAGARSMLRRRRGAAVWFVLAGATLIGAVAGVVA